MSAGSRSNLRDNDPERAKRVESDDEDLSSVEDEDEDVEDPTQKSAGRVLWEGISTFFVETSVHGFKYIVEDSPSQLWEKLFWTVTLCLSLTIAGVLFSDSILAWQTNPMVINLGDTGLPVRNLDFPAVTVCDDQVTDRWYFIEALLNVLDLNCRKDSKPVVCEYLATVYKTVWTKGPVDALDEVFQVSEQIEATEEVHYLLQQVLPIEKQELLRQMELISFYTDDIQRIMSEYSKVLGKEPDNYRKLQDLIEDSFSAIKDVSDINCYDYPSCWNNFKIFYVQILLTESENHPIGLKGSLITHFASALGGSFKYDPEWMISKDVLDSSQESLFVQNFLKSLTVSMTGESISLLDVPAMASASLPYNTPLNREAKWLTQPVTEVNSRECTANDFASYAGYWKAYQDRSYVGQNECQLDGVTNKCCNYWEKSLASNLKSLMLIMKYSQLHGKSSDAYEEYSKDFIINDLVIKNLGFTTNQSLVFTDEDFNNLRNLRNSLLVTCALGTKDLADLEEKLESGNADELPSCKSFDPMTTNRGICHTFNAISFRAMGKDNHYMNSFVDTYHPKESDELEPIPGAGVQNGFKFILDANSVGRPNPDPGTKRAADFRVALSDAFSPFDVQSEPVYVKAGTTTRIRVTPEVTGSAVGLQDSLSVAERECRYRDENENMKIFNDYTRAGCRFECMLDNAFDICQCSPWNYPYIKTGDIEICDMFGTACFNEMMSQVAFGEQCDCPSDCEEVSFTQFETNKDLNAEELCSDQTSWVYKYIANAKRNREGDAYKEAIQKVTNNARVDQSVIDVEECQNIVKYDLAIVTMEIAASSYSEFVREEATSIADQLANLGGTLGLFSGMSVLSMIEIFFWLRRIFFDVVSHVQLKRARNNA